MRSILEIMAIGATAAALTTAVQAGTNENDAKVNVGMATASVASPACAPHAATSPTGAAKGSADAKPDCNPVGGGSTTAPAAAPKPAH